MKALLLVSLPILGCLIPSSVSSVSSVRQDKRTQERVRRVILAKVELGPLQRRIKLQAEVLPLESIRLVARVTGYIERIDVDEGDFVDHEKLLVKLDCPDLEADLALSNAEASEAEAMVLVAEGAEEIARGSVAVASADLSVHKTRFTISEAGFKQAKADHTRVRNLHEKGAATDEEYEQIQLKLQTSEADVMASTATIKSGEAKFEASRIMSRAKKAEVHKANATLARAKSKVERAQVFLDFTKLRAPWPRSRVTRRLVDKGKLVHANETELLELMDVSKVRIRFGVPEVDAPWVKPGSKIIIHQPRTAWPSVEATVTRIAGALDPDTRSMGTEVELPNEDGRWMPGQLVKVEILTWDIAKAVMIPTKALLRNGNESYVWVAENNRARKAIVKLGLDLGRKFQVLSGLSGSEQIVLAGHSGLKEGSPLRSR